MFASPALAAEAIPSTVSMVTLEWPPYVGKDLPKGGVLAAHLRDALMARGQASEIHYVPWQRALDQAKLGEYDIVFPAYHSFEREKSFIFVGDLPSGPVGFFARKADNLSGKSLDDLRKLRLGVVRGYVNVPEVDDDPRWTTDDSRNDRVNLIKLNLGRIDLAFMDKQVGDYIIATDEPDLADKLEFIEMGFTTPGLYACIPRDLPYAQELADVVTRALLRASQSAP